MLASQFVAHASGVFEGGGLSLRCALGRAGVVAARDKCESDGASPAGVWPLRRVFYRADRTAAPLTGLPVIALQPSDGWSDDPADVSYNRLVSLPWRHRHERLWRADHVYDLIAELGYNDDPVAAGKGSAIFLHLARPGYPPTEGCVALEQADLRAVLRLSGGGSCVEIRV